eukprot:13475637-Alexandrium_andersonii.AAC.1
MEEPGPAEQHPDVQGYMLACACGYHTQLPARPARGASGWPRQWCRGCKKQARVTAYTCTFCGNLVPRCQC